VRGDPARADGLVRRHAGWVIRKLFRTEIIEAGSNRRNVRTQEAAGAESLRPIARSLSAEPTDLVAT